MARRNYRFDDEEHIPVERFFADGVELLWGRWLEKYSYLCLALKEAEFKPAFPPIRESILCFLSRRDPNTGLIEGIYAEPETGLQKVSMGAMIMGFLEWFDQDEEIVGRCGEFADSIWRHFRCEEGGLYSFVKVDTGRPKGLWTYTADYGVLSRSYARLYITTAEETYRDRCEYLVNFVWSRRFKETNIPPNTLSCNGGFPGIEGVTFKYPQTDSPMVDTDCLYWVNAVYDTYNILGDPYYRDIALQATEAWLRYGWREEWEHFVVCVNADGSPGSGPFFERVYADAKYNTLRLMTNAYKVTGDGKYMGYFDRFWSCLKRNAVEGLIPYLLDKGRIPSPLEGPGTGRHHPGNVKGLDCDQAHFIGLLLDAWEATGEGKYLEDAEAVKEAIFKSSLKVLSIGPYDVHRGLGHNLVRLSLASGKLVKASVNLKEPGWKIAVSKEGKNLLEEAIEAKRAILYLDKGWYMFKIESRGSTKEFKIYLNKDMNLYLNPQNKGVCNAV